MFVHKPNRNSRYKKGNRDMIHMIIVDYIPYISTAKAVTSCSGVFWCLTGSPQEGRASKASRTEGVSASFVEQIPALGPNQSIRIVFNVFLWF